MPTATIDHVRELTAKAEAARTQAIDECNQRVTRAGQERDQAIARAKEMYARQAQEITAELAELGAKAKRGRPANSQTTVPGEKRRRPRKEQQG